MTNARQTLARVKLSLGRRLRRIGVAGVLIFVVLVAAMPGRNAEKLGDRFQIALPLLAWSCAIADGRGVQLFGRYLLLEIFVKMPKNTLGMHPIAVRPNGRDQGFPSGHTAAAAFGATALAQTCLRDSRGAIALAVIAAGFVGATRIESENHNIWQVLAGALVGWLVTALTLSGFDRLIARLWGSVARLWIRRPENG